MDISEAGMWMDVLMATIVTAPIWLSAMYYLLTK